MAKKKSAPPKHVEPEEESQEVEEQEEPETEEQDDEPEAGGGKAISKAEAIRRVIADGIDNPSLGSQEIKKRFGLDVTPQHFSATKAQMKSREGSKVPKGKPGRKPKAEAEGEPRPAPAATPAAPPESNMIDDLAAVKHLVQKLGAEQVRKIVGLFE